ncbi:MAG: alpha/beta hydrolase domain-containing protein [Chloroflexi bacterium]|nr:alpha/beta hydrolase domain-containing protein [Chloroflexota bacterium]
MPRAQVAEAFRAIPGASVPDPDRLWTVPRVDLGTGEESGVGSFPPATGEVFPTLVSAVDSDGNEVAGIRLPDLTTPLGTHAGWNVRHPQTGGAGQIMPMVGSTLPFAATRGEREASADPRPSIEERYGGRDEYLARVRSDAARLAADRYLLTEDIEVLVADAVARWDVMVPVTAR